MSEVILAENAGFCPGVRAATERLARRMERQIPGERLFTLGHLIHNEDYNRRLCEAGVTAISAEELPRIAREADAAHPATVFIRAHG
ncbi:MAG: 4-hydroxy-3-methylbut-2-enyl diphosphate reductase, partial [Clostridia bacterium]|nr:4-hydroxy-3-methylbut-2-enyl diphosphate reductase [Clostridia bacterium]